jgi:bifunctional UDP-N-acetylglucosamine pyrophosphorylase/glucosamine-1-phosphate N-acetyltransferase
MAESALGAIILAAGQGKRLRSERPKVLADVMGRPALAYVTAAVRRLDSQRVCVVVGHGAEQVQTALKSEAGLTFVVQQERKGTAHAALTVESAFAGFTGRILVLYGDGPLVPSPLLERVLAHHVAQQADATMVSAVLDDPTGYGRVVRTASGAVERVVEEKDADQRTRAIQEINTGLGVFESRHFFADLKRIGNANKAQEYYLTDIFEVVRARGGKVEAFIAPDGQDVLGFNSLSELSMVRRQMRQRIVERLMASGVDIVAPDLVYIEDTVEIAPGARILPFCVFSGNVRIASECEVGPFTHLRPGTVLEQHAEIGNFTEVKNSTVGPRSKAKHLTYLGDAKIGADVNIGAGTITANYDGKKKYPTVIGDKAFVGSGTVFVAPSEMGSNAMTGAGAIVTRGTKIGDGEVVVGVPARVLRKRTAAESERETKSR